MRPAAWGMRTFCQLLEVGQRHLLQQNPPLNALVQRVQRGQAYPLLSP